MSKMFFFYALKVCFVYLELPKYSLAVGMFLGNFGHLESFSYSEGSTRTRSNHS